jgi:hypothetical protein
MDGCRVDLEMAANRKHSVPGGNWWEFNPKAVKLGITFAS